MRCFVILEVPFGRCYRRLQDVNPKLLRLRPEQTQSQTTWKIRWIGLYRVQCRAFMKG